MTTPRIVKSPVVNPEVVAPTLTTFFKGADTKFGIFYPTDYLVAVFPNMTSARCAEKALGLSGFLDADVITVPGEEVVRFADEHLKHCSLWGMLMQQLSRMFATEEVYTDHDLQLAAAGSPFLAAYCPDEKRKQQAWVLIAPFEPLVARHYKLTSVEHFKGEL
jgi:hypothetical protein